jgi:hypothetical protein
MAKTVDSYRRLGQSDSSASHLIVNMTNVHMRSGAKERRCGGAEGNRLTKTALQRADPTPVTVNRKCAMSNLYGKLMWVTVRPFLAVMALLVPSATIRQGKR